MTTEPLPQVPEPGHYGHEPDDRHRAPRRGRGRWAAAAVAAVVLFGLGVVVGAVAIDPTTSEEYAALSAEKSEVESEYAALQQDHESLQEEHDAVSAELTEREAELEEAEEELENAQEALERQERESSGSESGRRTSTVRDGTWTVGDDIAAGTYRTVSAVDADCSWVVRSAGGSILDQDVGEGERASVTLSTGQEFETSGCGPWVRRT